PGCSTGEEAYSIAICWMEFLSDSANVAQIQIFATDISDQAIEKARVGIYPDGIGADVSPERLRRFFMKVEGGYQINKAIRDMCIFARQDVTRDPPFSKLDLISCRNVLIYLGPVLQKKVLPIFHYALNPGGFLLLGSSETVGSFADLFSLVDKKQKIYSRKATGGRPIADFATRDYAAENLEPHKAPVKSDEVGWKTFDLQRESDRAVLNKYAPPGVTVNDDLDILQFRGHTSPYLEPRPGVASLNLLKMLRDDLLLDVRSAIHEAKKKDRSVRRANLRVRHDGLAKTLDIEVIPLRSPANDRFFLILFEQNEGKPGLTEERALRKRPDNKFPPGKSLTPAKQRALRQEMGRLSQELDATQSYLQATIEDHDATNEALRSANEEVQSSNEELQSTNEELETAKEELQSANEELTTVNEELQNRNIELNQLNNDLSNLLTGVDTPILMLGHDLRIRRFNVPSEKMFNLIATDVARPISDIKTNIDIPHLEKQVLEVVDSLQPIEREIRDKDGRWYSMRIRPYRTSDNKIDGALVSFLDIDALRSSRLEMQELQSCIDCLMDAVPPPLLVLDGRLRVKLASGSFYQTFQLTPEETIARPVYEVGDRLLDEPDFRAWLVKSTVGGNNRPVLDITHDFKNAGKGRFLVNASSNGSAGDNGPFIVLAFTEKSL
ncbi:MAG TPA: CheR family methyltransferase, partial [Blastocatellia bacterium]|nr:CheR family methyltransferase [Blastocatellia bacterium]